MRLLRRENAKHDDVLARPKQGATLESDNDRRAESLEANDIRKKSVIHAINLNPTSEESPLRSRRQLSSVTEVGILSHLEVFPD